MGIQEELNRLSTPRTTREDVVSYYKEQYPGSRGQRNGKPIENWKAPLAQALSPIAGLSKDSLMRRFQDRKGVAWDSKAPGKKAQDEYRKLGEMLPPITPKGYVVEAGSIIWLEYSSEGCLSHEVKKPFTIVGESARMLNITASPQIVVNSWHHLAHNAKGGPHACAEPQLMLSALL